jgi:uncharacterized protein
MRDFRSWTREAADRFRRLPSRDRLRRFVFTIFAACLAVALAGGYFVRAPRLVPPEPEPAAIAEQPAPAVPAQPPAEPKPAPAKPEAFIYEEHHAYPPTPPKRPEPALPPGPVHPGAKLAVVIDDLGESAAFARKLTALGIPLTLAVMPRLGESAETAKAGVAAGCDVILHQPMEPKRRYMFPPGSGALTMDMDPAQVRAALAANLASIPGLKGVNNHMGSRYTESAERMGVVLEYLKGRGLFFLDSQTSQDSKAGEAARKTGQAIYTRDVFLDNVRSVQAILAQLRLAERIALSRGQAVAIGHPYPETLVALTLWTTQRDKRARLAGVSELVPH